jgi:hypothetical protein
MLNQFGRCDYDRIKLEPLPNGQRMTWRSTVCGEVGHDWAWQCVWPFGLMAIIATMATFIVDNFLV